MVHSEVQMLFGKHLVSLDDFAEEFCDRYDCGNDSAGINSKDLVV